MPRCPCLRPEEPEVHVLDYRHCSLDNVPADVFNYERTLEELYVDANAIRDLPRELFFCHGIRKLCVSDNEITSIPQAISSLGHLEHLDISKNGVVDLPDSIKGCKYLSIIEASVNPLGKLPEGFTQLLNLKELYLNDTFLDFLPGSFGRLSHLKILEVRENHLKTLPKSLSHLTALERLDIGNNEFTELPEVVGSLVNLMELWCDSNQVTRLPETIGGLKQLMYFDASKNRIESLPNEIDGCVALADLHLSTNLLQQLPENIGRLSNMTTLKVDDNRLTSLPFSIGGLVSLSELNISANDLEELPPSIGFLRHLRTLYADENFIYEIPPELGSCNGLTVVSFRSNNLVYIPDELGRIPRLRVLNLSDNKIRFLPYSLTRLKELQALWLSENQTKPLIRLQPDIDVDTGRRMLTCYLLPQQPQDDNDDMYSDHGSFHPSLWEEERKTRQRIHFDFEDYEEPTRLERIPTPYPKEMKHRIQHMRNLALKQLNVPNGAMRPGPDPGGGGQNNNQQQHEGDGGEGLNEDTGNQFKPVSPLMAGRHQLLKADKEKNARDKERMSHQRRSQEPEENGAREIPSQPPESLHQSRISIREQPSPGFQSGSQRNLNSSLERNAGHYAPSPQPTPQSMPVNSPRPVHQSNISLHPPCQTGSSHSLAQSRGTSVKLSDFDPSLALSGPAVGGPSPGYRGPSRPSSVHSEQLQVRSRPSSSHHYRHHPNQYPHQQYSGSHSRRSKGYESDTGYRSETHSEVGYRSDTGFRLHHNGRRGEGYSSDMEVIRRGGRNSQSLPREGGGGSDVEGYAGRRAPHHGYRPLSGSQAPRHPGGGHGNPYPMPLGGGGSKTQSYSNAPQFRRTKIQNDELYEQQCAPPMPSHPPITSSTSKGMRTVQEEAQRPTGSGQNADGSNEDELWKAQLYKASVKLQKTPSDKRKKVQAPIVEQSHNDSNDSVFVPPPPYQPAPPYSTTKSKEGSTPRLEDAGVEPHHPQHKGLACMDIPVMASSPKLGRPRSQEIHSVNTTPRRPDTVNNTPRRPETVNNTPRRTDITNITPGRPDTANSTPRRPEMDHLQRPNSGHYVSRGDVRNSPMARPSHLPLPTDSNGPPAPRSVPDGRPQTLPNQSPCLTPRGKPTNNNNIGEHLRTPDRRSQPPDYRSPHVRQGHTPVDKPLQLTQYDKDVAVYKQLEPPSQVSSSTDSGYGPHIYDRVAGQDAGHPSPSPRGQSPRTSHPSTPQTHGIRASPCRDSAIYSRESTPGQQSDPVATPGSTNGPATSPPRSLGESQRRSVGPPDGHNDSAEFRDSPPRNIDVFRVTIAKNPGLGFSIAGGIGSPGNPFIPGDEGIFVTKVQDQGPASAHLRRGDKLLEVNGIDFTSIDHREAVRVLRNSSYEVMLVVERNDLPPS